MVSGTKRVALAVGLVALLATLGTVGLTSPLETARAQSGSRLCGAFWYTQVEDPTNDNTLTWFTVGQVIEIDHDNSDCSAYTYISYGAEPDIAAYRVSHPEIPKFLQDIHDWTHEELKNWKCEEFAQKVVVPPNGEKALAGGQDWPAGDPDPCNHMERTVHTTKTVARFWFKHL
jgi:hypothetical protein